jgi:hypothetical protein
MLIEEADRWAGGGKLSSKKQGGKVWKGGKRDSIGMEKRRDMIAKGKEKRRGKR